MSFDKHHDTIECDGGGWTGCNSYFDRKIDETVAEVRRRAKTAGWKRVKGDDSKMYDFCPSCGMNV